MKISAQNHHNSNIFLTVKDVADVLGVSVSTIRSWNNQKKINSVRDPKTNERMFSYNEVERVKTEMEKSVSDFSAYGFGINPSVPLKSNKPSDVEQTNHFVNNDLPIHLPLLTQASAQKEQSADKYNFSNTFLFSKYALLALVVFFTGIAKAYFPVQEYVEKAQGIVKQEMILGITDFNKQNASIFTPKVLGEETIQRTKTFTVNIATRLASLTVDGIATFNNNIDAIGQNLNLGTGNITAGNVIYSIKAGAGLTISGTQDITINNEGVQSIGGEIGEIELEAGTGISIDGLTIENVGITGLTGTSNQVTVSAETGSVTLSLPQNIATSSSPTFAGLTISGDILLNGNTTGTDIADSVIYYDASDQTQSNKVIGIKTSKTTVTDYNFSVDAQGNVYAHSLSLTGGLTLAPDLTVTDKTTLGTVDGPSGWDNDFTVALGTGDYAFTYNDNISALSLFNFNNTTDLLTIGNSSMVTSFGSNVGIGTTAPGAYKLNVNGNTNITGNLTVTGDVDSATGSIVILDGTTLTYTTGNLTTLDLGTNTIYDSNLTGNWAFNSGNLSAVGTIGSGAITSTGAVQGTSLTDGTATLTSGAWTGLTGVTSSGTITFSGLGTGVVQSNASGVLSNNLGTASYITRWNASGVTNANIYDNVGNIGVGGTAPATVPSLYVGANGNVGIGNTNPSYAIDIIGSANLTTGNAYYINGASVLNATTLGTNIITSSLTTLGTIGTGIWEGTSVKTGYGGTGLTSYTAGDMTYYATGTAFSKLGIGSSGYILTSTGTAPQWSTITDSISSTAFIQNGNSFTANAVLGTNDGYALSLETGGVSKLYIDTTGNIGIGGTAPSASPRLYVGANGNVGIGTTGPVSRLHVIGSGNHLVSNFIVESSTGLQTGFSGEGYWRRDGATDVASVAINRVGYNDGTSYFRDVNIMDGKGTTFAYFDGSQGGFAVGSGYADYTVATPTDGMIIKGNVGIGTTGPGAKLHLSTDAAASANGQEILRLAGTLDGGTVGSGPKIVFRNLADTVSFGEIRAVTDAVGDVGMSFSTWSTTLGQRLTITGAGNVGIGTTGPGYKLDVVGDAQFGANSWLRVLDTGAGNGRITSTAGLALDNTTTYFRNAAGTIEYARIADGGNFGIGYADPGTAKLAINGNVGIGTTGPTVKLQVAGGQLRIGTPVTGDANPFLDLYSTTSTSKIQNINGHLSFGHSGAAVEEALTILATSGNVGIGTTAPVAKLTIFGSTTEPSLTHNAAANFDIKDWANGTDLAFGSSGNSPYAAWIQNRHDVNDGTAYPITLNPLGGTVGIGYENPGTTATLAINGNVGIGTTAPTGILEISKASPAVYVTDTGTSYAQFAVRNSSSTFYFGQENSSGGSMLAGSSPLAGIINMANGNSLQFGTSNAVRMTITSSGNVGIGTTVPTSKLHISGSMPLYGSTPFLLNTSLSATSPGGASFSPVLTQVLAAGTVTGLTVSPTVVVNNTANIVSALRSYGYAITNNGTIPIATGLYIDQPVITGTAATWQGALYVSSGQSYFNGNVGIGTTTPGTKLDIIATTDREGLRIYGTSPNYNYPAIRMGRNYSGDSNSRNWAMVAEKTMGSLEFWSSTAAAGEPIDAGTAKMVIDKSGNVGIGTTSPTSKLTVSTVFASTPQDVLTLDMVGNASPDRGPSILFNTPLRLDELTSIAGGRITVATDNPDFAGTTYMSFGTAVTGTISEKVRITSTGNVGIGTTGPGATLDVNGASILRSTLLVGAATAVSPVAAQIEVQNNGASVNSVSFMDTQGQTTDVGGTFSMGGKYTDAGAYARFAKIQGAKENSTTGNSAGYLSFITNANGGATTITEKMRITSTGNVGIGTTGPGAKLDILGGNNSALLNVSRPIGGDNQAIINLFLSDQPTYKAQIMAQYSDANPFSITDRNGVVIGDYNGHTALMTGNVGIGTTAPGAKLDVASGDIRINRGQNIGPYVAAHTNFGTTSTSFGNYVGGTFAGMSVATTWDGTYDDEIVQFSTHDGGTSAGIRMTIDKSGNVGIGTTAPGDALQIGGGTARSRLRIEGNENYAIGMKNGTGGTYTWMGVTTGGNYQFSDQNGNALVTFQQAGNVGIGTTAPRAQLEVYGGVYGTLGSHSGSNYMLTGGWVTSERIAMSTNSYADWGASYGPVGGAGIKLGDGSNFSYITTNGTNLLLNPTAGNVGIGTTAPSRKLEVNGNIRMGALITGAGSAVAVYRDVNGDLADSTSSIRYKDNVVTYEDILPKLEQLRTVRFDWNSQTSTPGMRDFGMIAEEVNSIFPELVNYETDGVTPRGLKYEKMGLFALKGVQELSTLITAQQVQIASLTNAVNVSTDGAISISGGLISTSGNVGTGTGKLHVEGQCVTGDTLLRRRRRRKGKNGEDSKGDNSESDSGPSIGGQAVGDDDVTEDTSSAGDALNGQGNVGTGTDWEDVRIDQIQAGDEILSLNEEEWDNGNGTIATSVSNSALRYARVNALMDMDIKEVYEITTRSGRKIRTTSAHPYLVLGE